MDKDDKKTKLAARKMITMMFAINNGHFDGEREVTCYTCHHGVAHHSQRRSSLPMSLWPHPVTIIPNNDEAAAKSLPTAAQIFEKYLAAVGGADALQKIHSRIQKGTLDAFGSKFPSKLFPKRRTSVFPLLSRPPGPSVTAFNGETGWLSMPNGFHQMSPAEQEAARIDAQFNPALRFPQLYPEYRVRLGEPIDGKPTYVVTARADGNRPGLRLYFDQDSGLLLRQIRLAETPLGRNPTEVDYADYRSTDGVKIPYRWTLSRPNGRFTIQVDDVKQNVPVDEKLFVMPAAKETPH